MTRTTALFAVPNFIRGLATTLDVGVTLTVYNDSEDGSIADYKALRSDWFAVGDDMHHAVNKWESTYGKQTGK